MCSYFCKNLPVVMYRKFRNVPTFKDIPPICPYFLGFRVGKYALDVAPEIEVQWSQIRAINVAEILCHAQCRPLFQGTAFGVVPDHLTVVTGSPILDPPDPLN